MNDLAFLAPARLFLLAVPAALVIAYVLLASRRRRYALRFTTVEMLDRVAPDRPGWRRHVSAIAMILSVSIITLAFAKPVVAGEVEESTKQVVLAIDTSISMEARDVSPSRVDAAREAAVAFLDSVPEGVSVGVIAFDGNARELIAPTSRLEAVRSVIESSIEAASLGEGTAIGEAVYLGVASLQSGQTATAAEDAAQPIGTIVLMSDGDTTMGRSNDEAASAARAAGIPVHTIAFGTDAGTIEDPLGGGMIPVPVNEAALEQLAHQTGGRALTAQTADQLSDVYEDLGRSVTVEREEVEVADLFAGAAMAILVLAGVGSLRWSGRLP
jgi:Ca-activated chloride channel family protein